MVQVVILKGCRKLTVLILISFGITLNISFLQYNYTPIVKTLGYTDMVNYITKVLHETIVDVTSINSTENFLLQVLDGF